MPCTSSRDVWQQFLFLSVLFIALLVNLVAEYTITGLQLVEDLLASVGDKDVGFLLSSACFVSPKSTAV